MYMCNADVRVLLWRHVATAVVNEQQWYIALCNDAIIVEG